MTRTPIKRRACLVIRTDVVRVNVAEPGAKPKHRWLRVVDRTEEGEVVRLTLEDGQEYTVTADCVMQVM